VYNDGRRRITLLGKNKVITTIAVHDIENAVDFYENVLGLKRVGKNVGGVVFESGGGTIGIYLSASAGSGQTTCAWWTVDDVEATMKDLRSKGVTFDKNYDMPHATRKGDMYLLGNDTKAAWFKDPDGNILGLGNF
jgi:catechol 2,3-dioxygenase-like lactoylglutathione lyase family enzyme